MSKRALWTWAIGVTLAALSAPVALAAPPPQGDSPSPTPTETETPVYSGPTSTPTATLLPPPTRGGRAAFQNAGVWVAPLIEADTIDALDYGEVIYPVARSANGVWIAINREGNIYWVLARQIVWDPALDLAALPIFIPPFTSTPLLTTPAPTGTGTPPPPATATPRPPATPAPSALPPTQPPAPTGPPAPSATPVAGVALPPSATPTPAISEGTRPDIQSLLGSLPPGLGSWLGGGVMFIALVLYAGRWMAGRRELRRYADGFVLTKCPVCQRGHLHLEEHVLHPLGIPHVRRSVRCNTCRSVLRETRSGFWRYTIDPFMNPDLAAEFNAREFSDEELIAFAGQARQYKSQLVEQEEASASPEFEEIVEEILKRELPPSEEETAGEALAESSESSSDEIGAASDAEESSEDSEEE